MLLYVCIFFIHSSIGHSGSFHLLATVNDAANNTGVLSSLILDPKWATEVLLSYKWSNQLSRVKLGFRI